MRHLILISLAGLFLHGVLSFAQEPNSDETNLKDALQSARAVPYVDPATGKSNGYIVQSPQTSAESNGLKIRQGDVLTGLNGVARTNALDLRLGNDCRMCSVCFLKDSSDRCLNKMVVVTELENVPFIWKCSKIPNQESAQYVYGLNETGLNKEKELCSRSESNQFFFHFKKEGEKLLSTLHAKDNPKLCIGIREGKPGTLRALQEACDGSPEQHLISVYGRVPSERID